MSGIAEGAEIGVMRSNDEDSASLRGYAVELFHGAHHVGDVLDDMHGANGGKGGAPERIGETVQIADDVGAGGRIPIDADRTGIFIDTAADVQNASGHA